MRAPSDPRPTGAVPTESGGVPYREKLMPSLWVFLATALVIPASLLVFLPISPAAGIIVALGLFGASTAALIGLAPVVEVRDGMFRVGNAAIELEYLGEPQAFDAEEATAERGVRLDARAYLVLRGWVKPVVKLPIEDPADPVPYWLVSTRRPNDVVAAIRGSRRREEDAAEGLA